jgi:negative regulator of sigma E activity
LARGEALESFAFTHVRIGGPPEHGALKPGFDRETVRVQNVRTTEMRSDDMGWTFRTQLPGFRKVSSHEAASRRGECREPARGVFGWAGLHFGFHRAGRVAGERDTTATLGPVNVFRRQVDAHRVVVMGEVPAIAVRRLGEGVERRRK